MTDIMRDYCRLTSCRREYICNYFEAELKSIDPPHLCCDICRSQCECDLCKASVAEAPVAAACPLKVTDEARDAVKQMLVYYFSQENAISLTSDQVVPHLITGLSENLADQISRDDAVYNSSNRHVYLNEMYPHLQESFVINIDAIISKVRDVKLS